MCESDEYGNEFHKAELAVLFVAGVLLAVQSPEILSSAYLSALAPLTRHFTPPLAIEWKPTIEPELTEEDLNQAASTSTADGDVTLSQEFLDRGCTRTRVGWEADGEMQGEMGTVQTNINTMDDPTILDSLETGEKKMYI